MKLLFALLFTAQLLFACESTIICDAAIELNLNGYACYQFEQLWPGSAVTIEVDESTYIEIKLHSRSDSTIAADYGIVHIPFLQSGNYRFGFEGHGIDTVHIICADYQVPVELIDFYATPSDSGIRLCWRTGEVNNIRFKIYRESILLTVIPGNRYTYTYEYLDRYARPGVQYEYFLACVENGRREVLDSITVFYDEKVQLSEPSMKCHAGKIRLVLPRSTRVKLAVYNILGRQVAVLANGYFQAGPYRLRFDGSPHPTGIYLVRGQFGDGATVTRKMSLVK